ncbi:hypothetical protein RvY_00829 [Ramazzottius varieornatus]|uniref:Uncharacterized protein n=1 Tax=Ramazzottius varieornatus TaxID=947166 RepID=A0A1D1UE47_RAMVA|nr:hypothetical protein RvY_00829 [Ramazzottius varieornatus]
MYVGDKLGGTPTEPDNLEPCKVTYAINRSRVLAVNLRFHTEVPDIPGLPAWLSVSGFSKDNFKSSKGLVFNRDEYYTAVLPTLLAAARRELGGAAKIVLIHDNAPYLSPDAESWMKKLANMCGGPQPVVLKLVNDKGKNEMNRPTAQFLNPTYQRNLSEMMKWLMTFVMKHLPASQSRLEKTGGGSPGCAVWYEQPRCRWSWFRTTLLDARTGRFVRQ